MQISDSNISIYEKLSTFLVIALGTLMPVFFLATTTEFFEFNKARYEEIYQEREPEMVFSAMKKAGKADASISDHCPGFG